MVIKKGIYLTLAAMALGFGLSGCTADQAVSDVATNQVSETPIPETPVPKAPPTEVPALKSPASKALTPESLTPDTAMPPTTAKTLTRQEFGDKVLGVLKEELPDYEFQWKDTNGISVYKDGQEPLAFDLVNSYNDYLANGEDLALALDTYADAVSTFLAARDNPVPISRDSIMATIRSWDYIEYAQGLGSEPIYEELAEGLYILYMLDTPQAAKALTERDLDEIGVKRDELRDLAVKNLTETIVPLIEIIETEGIYLTIADGMYESGLILCDIWELYPVENDYAISIPERSCLLIADSNNLGAIEMMKGFGENLFNESNYPITDKLLCWTGSEFYYLTQ